MFIFNIVYIIHYFIIFVNGFYYFATATAFTFCKEKEYNRDMKIEEL